jgi:hypothetical protein
VSAVPVCACWLWLLGLAVRILPVRPLGVVGSASVGDKSGNKVYAARSSFGTPGEDVRRLERLVVGSTGRT